MIGARGCFVLLLLVLLAGAIVHMEEPTNGSLLSGGSLADRTLQQWKLPSKLREISGLALTPGGRLFAVDDEKAVIYEIDYVDGGLVKSFKLGKPVLKGDFEGIAYFDEHFFLVTSNGILYKFAEGRDGGRVEYEEFDTGLGEQCEIEGLAQDIEGSRLLLVCKEMHDGDEDLAVFFWGLSDGHAGIDGQTTLPVVDILAKLGTKNLHPSGIAVNPLSGSIVMVAARQHALIEMDRDGNLISAIILPDANRHKQSEGIEISAADELIISDEGGKSRARLSVYSSRELKEQN